MPKREYERQAWANAVQRGVVPRWERFHLFLRDMGPRPEGHGLLRFDHTRLYGPDHCRWAPLGLVRSHNSRARRFRPSSRLPSPGTTVDQYILDMAPFFAH